MEYDDDDDIDKRNDDHDDDRREREVHLIVLIDVVDADITSTCNLRALFILLCL